MNTNQNLAHVIIFPRKDLLRSEPPPPRPQRRPTPRIEHLTMEQMLALFAQARAARERDWLLFLVSFWHGLRASEAVSLKREHFDNGSLTVQRLKGSLKTRQRLVAHDNSLLNEQAGIEVWLARCSTDLLFPISRIQFYRLMRVYGGLAGIPKHLCHPHTLKHSIAMQSIQRAGIENVRQYLGHRSIASTGAYLKVSDEAASLAVTDGVASGLCNITG